ncbi:threonine/serine dehydratase [Jeotgalibacillus sp. ET6]|uniref:threonine ammonia-lyase n=1 Tax=Jeotgalibacillus sp. ET6 TaxID=3037260 RepID=UPI002418B988|nr:threonine/serine dehydratase [Jeotgalibacillus sp. ET6]MDG5470152.1 threonine/serine dehydratase [Jeotgalibacillus sp. ET6]
MVHRTPCKQSKTLNIQSGHSVWMKLENLQRTGSFKIRGAFNKISQLTELECKRGIVAASAGNHAQGVALAGREKGVQVTIFMPTNTPLSKVNATREYGARVELTGDSFDEAYEESMRYQKKTGATFVHPFDDAVIIEGQATVALEMLQQNPELETVLVPAGGGGLLAGTALAIKLIRPDIKVVGVQAASAPAIASAFHQLDKNLIPFQSTIAEGIKVKSPGVYTSEIIQSYVDDMITVSEVEIAEAILFMLEREKMLTEGAGAAGIAAILGNHLPSEKSQQVGVIVSGGNLDIAKLEICRQTIKDDQKRKQRSSYIL